MGIVQVLPRAAPAGAPGGACSVLDDFEGGVDPLAWALQQFTWTPPGTYSPWDPPAYAWGGHLYGGVAPIGNVAATREAQGNTYIYSGMEAEYAFVTTSVPAHVGAGYVGLVDSPVWTNGFRLKHLNGYVTWFASGAVSMVQTGGPMNGFGGAPHVRYMNYTRAWVSMKNEGPDFIVRMAWTDNLGVFNPLQPVAIFAGQSMASAFTGMIATYAQSASTVGGTAYTRCESMSVCLDT